MIRAGLESQFFIKKKMNQQVNTPMGFLRMHGSDGTWASVGVGLPIGFLFNTSSSTSFLVSPVIRYALLETQTPTGLYGPEKWGFTLDLHNSIQWRLNTQNSLFRKSVIGIGVSLINIGQSFDTKYSWVTGRGQAAEYQATTLMTLGVHIFYEQSLSPKFSTKFMVIYTGGNFINWIPLYEYTMHGNISVSYNLDKKSANRELGN